MYVYNSLPYELIHGYGIRVQRMLNIRAWDEYWHAIALHKLRR